MLNGCITALVTPMTTECLVDFSAIEQLVTRQLNAGVQGILVGGSTGESATLTSNELEKIIQTVVKKVRGQVPVIAGTGTPSTAETIAKTKQAFALGVDACLVITPYYNRPPQRGLLQHFLTIAQNSPGPIILYNNPPRTNCNLLPETVEILAKQPNIVSLKEGFNDADRWRDLKEISAANTSFNFVCGDDISALQCILSGGKGLISTIANLIPEAMTNMCKTALSGDYATASEINDKYTPLYKLMGCEANPIPIKWAMAELGWIDSGIRSPLMKLDSQYHEQLKTAMIQAGLII